MLFIGVDPGANGAIAVLDCNGVVVGLCPFSGRTNRDIHEWVIEFDKNHGTVGMRAYIEKVHAMPKQGVTSSFSFGMRYGFITGILTAWVVPIEDVTPQKWQKAMGCMSRGDKNVTKAKAQSLWPTTKITHAIADALLIAEYGRRTWQERSE